MALGNSSERQTKTVTPLDGDFFCIVFHAVTGSTSIAAPFSLGRFPRTVDRLRIIVNECES